MEQVEQHRERSFANLKLENGRKYKNVGGKKWRNTVPLQTEL